jgi:hypothetical protein
MHLYRAKCRQNVDGLSQILSIFVTDLCKKVTSNSEFFRITTYKLTNWELLLTFRIVFYLHLLYVIFPKAGTGS